MSRKNNTHPYNSNLVELGLGEVHLRVSVHELLEHRLLVLLFGCGQTGGFLALVVHHLLHGLSSVAVQVRQLAVLGLHLGVVCCKMRGRQNECLGDNKSCIGYRWCRGNRHRKQIPLHNETNSTRESKLIVRTKPSTLTFCVLISGSPLTTHFHHSILLSFCRFNTTSPSSRVQKESSTMMRL